MARKSASANVASTSATLRFQLHDSATQAQQQQPPPLSPADKAAALQKLTSSLSTITPGRTVQVHLSSSLPSTAAAANNQPAATAASDASASFSSPSIPRYSLTIVDHEPAASASASASIPASRVSSSASPPSCAILIISQGREQEYVFSHADGRLSLLRQQRLHRLVLVTLNRSHSFSSLAAVQDELRPFMPALLPPSCPLHSVPFLALGDDVGQRRPVAEEQTAANGSVVVEDVKLDGSWVRRLVFARTGLVMSEARLTAAGEPDFGHLQCEYQQAMLAGLSLLPASPASFLLIGLGAGSLPMLLSRCFPAARSTVLEIDADVARLAEAHFGFRASARSKLVIDDGIAFIESAAAAAASPYDVVIVDCNSADLSEGLSFPPAAFLSSAVLSRIYSLSSPPSLLLINFGCRSSSLRSQSLLTLLSVYDSLYELEVDDEHVNTVLAARKAGGGQEAEQEEREMTRSACRGRLLSRQRVQEERRRAQEAGLELEAELQWSDGMRLQDRLDGVQRISRQRTEEKEAHDAAQWKLLSTALSQGEDEEQPEQHETAAADDREGGEHSPTQSAEVRKRARTRARRAKQKLKGKK